MKSVEERWKVHKSTAKKKNSRAYNYPLYRAIRKYGIENFIIETIEECDSSLLDEREIYWIKKYDSTSKFGYNQTMGGGGNKHLDLDEENIINEYQLGKTEKEIANLLNCSPNTIHRILKKYNISIKSVQEIAKEHGYDTIQYDDNRVEIRRFQTTRDAARWLEQEHLTTTSNTTTSLNIRNAIIYGYKKYGFYWDSLKYSKEYKEELKAKQQMWHPPKNTNKEKKSIHKNQENKKKKVKPKEKRKANSIKKRVEKKTKVCPICGKLIQNKSNICADCYKIKQNNEFKQRQIEKGIDREVLKNKIRTQSFLSISKEYNVSDKTIGKWCKLYDLPYKSLEIKKYTDEEWEKI